MMDDLIKKINELPNDGYIGMWDGAEYADPISTDGLKALSRKLSAAQDKLTEAEAALRDATETLEWYAEQTRLCRLIHREGDAGRNALADDGGKRARKWLDENGEEK